MSSDVNVLLVDDNPEKVLALESILSGEGFNLVKVSSGMEALRELLRQDFALILLDVQMPILDGFETASLIRQRKRSEHTPIIFVSAISTNETHVSRGYRLGAVDYIFAPVEPEILKAKVAVFVELYRKTHQVQEQAEQLRKSREAEHQLRLAEVTRRLEDERSKNEFFANISHELRTPLTLILAPLESILSGDAGPLPDPMVAPLRTIHNNSVRLLQMVTGLLDFSRLEAGKLDVHPTTSRLDALARDLVADFAPRARSKSIDLALIAPETPAVLLDPYLFERILFNLLSNAVKFTSGGGRIEVRVELEAPAESLPQVLIEVRDTGIGIPAHDMDKLFRKFSQVQDTPGQRHEGTGLGLALVREIVDLLGGRIGVESRRGEGSVFKVTFPVRLTGEEEQEENAAADPAGKAAEAAEQAAESPGASASDPAASPAQPSQMHLDFSSRGLRSHAQVTAQNPSEAGVPDPLARSAAEEASQRMADLLPSICAAPPFAGGEGGPSPAPDADAGEGAAAAESQRWAAPDFKVLVAEDNPELSAHIASLLQPFVAVKVAMDGEEALEQVERWNPDLILSDVMMPRRDGFSLCRAVKSDPDRMNTPVVLLTALTHRDALIQGWEAGADEYLYKPFHPKELLSRVRSLLTAHQARLEAENRLKAYAAELEKRNRELTELSAELQQRSRELDASRESFRAIVEKSVDALLVVLEGGEVGFRNAAVEAFFDAGSPLFPSRRFPFPLEAGTAVELEEGAETGLKAPVEMWMVPTRWEGEKAFLVSLRDITERRKAQAELRETEDRFRQAQKLESIGRLAGGIAHDFNNLLTAINGYSEILLSQTDDDHPWKENLLEIRKAGDRAASLTHQLLAYSRKQVLAPKLVDLNQVVGDLAQMLKRLIGEDVQLVTELMENPGLVRVDPHQIEQALVNLVVNARDAMPRGGRIRLRTSLARLEEPPAGLVSLDGDGAAGAAGASSSAADSPAASSSGAAGAAGAKPWPGEFILLEVEDEGEGMDTSTLTRIFEPFFTTKGVGKGTGLGLSMVYGFVKQSGGHIAVSSSREKGTCFGIYLPLHRSKAAAPENGAGPARAADETLLVVEREEPVRRFLLDVLKQEGYRILDAASPEEALERSSGHPGPIHLLLTDLHHPDMEGGDLAKRISALRPGMQVLFLCADSPDALAQADLAGQGDFLFKPFSPPALAQKIRALLKPPVALAALPARPGP